MSTDPATITCSVCGEPAPIAMTAACNWCDQRYHLNQRNDIEGKDCGAVWIDEQYMALQFACNTCLSDPARAAGAGAIAAPAARTTALPSSRGEGQPRRRRYRRRE